MKARILTSLSIAACWLAAEPALAQTPGGEGDVLTSPFDTSSLIGTMASLLLVVAAILLVGWFYSRFRGSRISSSKVISVLAAQSLGPKERIFVIQIGDKQLAVGMTPGSLQTLCVFDEPVIANHETTTVVSFPEKMRAAVANMVSK